VTDRLGGACGGGGGGLPPRSFSCTHWYLGRKNFVIALQNRLSLCGLQGYTYNETFCTVAMNGAMLSV
jgi:hypothetical protein